MGILKNMLLIALFLCALNVFSQDIIITTDGKAIKTKIIELTSQKVSYKKFDYQEGATIVLELSKVKTIVWGNGDVENFNENEEPEKTQPNKKEKIIQSDETETERDYYDKQPQKAQEQPSVPPTQFIIDRNSNGIFFDNGEFIYNDEFADLLRSKNMEYQWNNYASGLNLIRTGSGLLITGIALNAVGIILTVVGTKELVPGEIIAGYGLIGVGSGLLTASIPVYIVGAVKKSIVINAYNNHIFQQTYSPTLKVGFNLTSIGFTLSF